jgi:hypothetical protein
MSDDLFNGTIFGNIGSGLNLEIQFENYVKLMLEVDRSWEP